MRTFILLLACTLLGLSAGSVAAQERGASNPVKADTGSQKDYGQTLNTDLSSLTTALQQPCTAADGSSKTDGTTWTDTCASGQHGTGIKRVCDKGVVVTTQNDCFTQNDCAGGHAADSTWSSSCPSGTYGSMTYRCSNGVATIDQGGSNCAIPNCNGRTYSVACPATTTDGISMSGTMTFQCQTAADNTQKMLLTGNTCRTYSRPCGGTANGNTVGYSCASIGGGAYGGTFNMTCTNGNSTNYLSYFGCTM